MAKKNTKNEETTGELAPSTSDNSSKSNNNSVIMGICELLVVASIAYMTSVIAMGTEGYIPTALAAPAAIFAASRLYMKFTK